MEDQPFGPTNRSGQPVWAKCLDLVGCQFTVFTLWPCEALQQLCCLEGTIALKRHLWHAPHVIGSLKACKPPKRADICSSHLLWKTKHGQHKVSSYPIAMCIIVFYSCSIQQRISWLSHLWTPAFRTCFARRFTYRGLNEVAVFARDSPCTIICRSWAEASYGFAQKLDKGGPGRIIQFDNTELQILSIGYT